MGAVATGDCRPPTAVLMLAYILRRLLLMIPTIFGIMLVSFAIVQFVPGGPVERAIAQLQGDIVTLNDPLASVPVIPICVAVVL